MAKYTSAQIPNIQFSGLDLMPFKSEKQRRFLWLKHPTVAKRWAHEYPKQKNLPMYARPISKPDDNNKNNVEEQKKEAALDILRKSLQRYTKQSAVTFPVFARSLSVNKSVTSDEKRAVIAKKSLSVMHELDIPHSEKPIAAGDENVMVKSEKSINNSGKNCNLTNVGNIKPEELFNLADSQIKPTLQKLGRLFQKYSAVIRLGKIHREASRSAEFPTDIDIPPQKTDGLNLPELNRGISNLKMQRAYSLQQAMMFPPAGSDKKTQAPGPVATYPGVAPQVAANKPAMQSPAANPLGMKGPLNTKNGIPTFSQNVTGNASFGKGSS
jgi:hypothetical protein